MFDDVDLPIWVRLVFGSVFIAIVCVASWSLYFKYDSRWVTSFNSYEPGTLASLERRDDGLWDIQVDGQHVARAAMQSIHHGVYEFKVVQSSAVRATVGSRFSLIRGAIGGIILCPQCQEPYGPLGKLLPIVWHLAD